MQASIRAARGPRYVLCSLIDRLVMHLLTKVPNSLIDRELNAGEHPGSVFLVNWPISFLCMSLNIPFPFISKHGGSVINIDPVSYDFR
jgi:hypothetical protein